jgi:hypothetical protein
MALIQKLFTLEITPERFVDNCSEVELKETALLIEARLNRLFPRREAKVELPPRAEEPVERLERPVEPKRRGRPKKTNGHVPDSEQEESRDSKDSKDSKDGRDGKDDEVSRDGAPSEKKHYKSRTDGRDHQLYKDRFIGGAY